MKEMPTQYIVWRFASNDDKESIEFKSDELSVDELSARSVNGCIDGVNGSVRPCTDSKVLRRRRRRTWLVPWFQRPR